MSPEDKDAKFNNFASNSGTNKSGSNGSWINFSFSLDNGSYGGFGNVTTIGTAGVGKVFVKDSQDDPLEKTGFIVGVTGLSVDATHNAYKGALRLSNSFSGTTKFAVKNLSYLEKLSRWGAATGVVVGVGDMFLNGPNVSNSLDVAFSAVALIPVAGWIISGAYTISNIAISATTGKSIGEHIETFAQGLTIDVSQIGTIMDQHADDR